MTISLFLCSISPFPPLRIIFNVFLVFHFTVSSSPHHFYHFPSVLSHRLHLPPSFPPFSLCSISPFSPLRVIFIFLFVFHLTVFCIPFHHFHLTSSFPSFSQCSISPFSTLFIISTLFLVFHLTILNPLHHFHSSPSVPSHHSQPSSSFPPFS